MDPRREMRRFPQLAEATLPSAPSPKSESLIFSASGRPELLYRYILKIEKKIPPH